MHPQLMFVVPALIMLVLADSLWGRFLIWSVPDETAWESAPLFQFEYRFRQLEQTAARERPVVLFGSSIAAYGFLPRRLERALNGSATPGQPGRLKVRMLARQGLNTMYFSSLAGRLIALKPRAVVVPVSMVDFRLERPIVLKVMNRLDEPAVRLQLARDLLTDRGFLRHAPAGTLRAHFWDLDLNGKAANIFGTTLATYRFRDIATTGLVRVLTNRFRKGRSYLHYAGVPILAGNVTWRGRTGRVFGMRVTSELLRSGLELEAPLALHRAAQRGPRGAQLRLQLWRLRSSGRRDCRSSDKLHLRDRTQLALRVGWQNIRLTGPGTVNARAGEVLCGRLNATYVSTLQADRLGVRLARNTGRALSELRSSALRRDIRREDLRYRAMTGAEYRKSFERRLLRFERSGMAYLHALKMAREQWGPRKFDERLPTARAFDNFRKRLAAAGIPLLVINAPENELSLGWYRGRAWYRSYLEFLGRPSGKGKYRFVDAHRLLPMQLFYDYHHLSYFGAERFSDFTANQLRPFFELQ